MHDSAWIAILRQIPPEKQHQYSVTTRSGVEITIQLILRIETSFVAFRGRPAGSQDGGRIYFLPYDNIDFLGSTISMRETEYEEDFGSLRSPAAVAPSSLPPEPAQVLEPIVAAGAARPPSSLNVPIRSEVLDRFRSQRPTSSPSLPSIPRPTQP
jgi:hypothetical protein